jgi:hypothetical protein
VKCYIWSIALNAAESWTLRKVDQKYLGSFGMCCLTRMENITWTDRVKNEVLQRVKEDRNVLHTVKRIKINWVCHILHMRRVIEGKIVGTERRGRRRKQLLDDLKETRYWMKEKALYRTLWRTRFERGYGPVVRHVMRWWWRSWFWRSPLRMSAGTPTVLADY